MKNRKLQQRNRRYTELYGMFRTEKYNHWEKKKKA